ncbi:MAG: NADPH:quinone reductase [Pseudomonadota bacterium]
MRAIRYTRFGPAETVLEPVELPTPDPAPGEVLVELRASGVNPSDVKLRAGARPGSTMAFPFVVPHSDGAGVIVACGEGVAPERRGQRVWIWNGQWRRQMGTAASHICLPAEQAVPLPEPASFAEGASLGIPAQTACAAVLGEGPVEGRCVMVTGAAGAVGRYAVQMARLAGAEVIATISSAEKAAHASSHANPPHHLIDYRREDVAERVMAITQGKGIDRLIEVDFGANIEVTEQIMADNGRIVSYASMAAPTPALPFYSLMFRNIRLWMLLDYLLEAPLRRDCEAQLGRWLEAGSLSHAIRATRPLEKTAEAHALVEDGGGLGNVIVEI